MHDDQPANIIAPPLTPEVAAWFRTAMLGAHYVPQAGMYEALTAQDQAEYVRATCNAAIVAVRKAMLDARELERDASGLLRVGPLAPPHPCG